MVMNATTLGIVGGALLAALVGSSAGWFARGAVADRIEIPRVIEQQIAACTATTAAIAAIAVSNEQLRQFKIGERATQVFIEKSQAAADDAQAERDLLELEIEHYAQRVRESGRVCALDADDLDLLGVRDKRNSPVPSGD